MYMRLIFLICKMRTDIGSTWHVIRAQVIALLWLIFKYYFLSPNPCVGCNSLVLGKRLQLWHKGKRNVFENSFQFVRINLKTLISCLFFPRDFLDPVSMSMLHTLSSVPITGIITCCSMLDSGYFKLVKQEGTWCCLTVSLALSSTGKNCLSPKWKELCQLSYLIWTLRGKDELKCLQDGLRFLEKSLSKFLAIMEPAKPGKKGYLLGSSYQERGKTKDSESTNSHSAY